MTALRWDLVVEQGSWAPEYIVVTDPASGEALDLTDGGYEVRGTVATRSDGRGAPLAEWADGEVLFRTAEGRIYFQPDPAVTAGWAWRDGWHQIELAHPSGKTVRVASGRIKVSAELDPTI